MTSPLLTARLVPADASELTALVRRVYEDSYPDRDVYDRALLETRLETGAQISVGVWSERALVGHMAIWRRRRPSLTVDAGFTMVDPAHRGARMSELLIPALREEMERAGLVGFHHYPVTVNTVTQRLGLASGGVPCGVLLAHVSAEATRHSARAPTRGRSDALVLYQPLAKAPARDLHIPNRDRDIVAEIVATDALPRTISNEIIEPSARKSRFHATVDPSRDLTTIEVEAIGRDLVVACEADSALVHIDLPAVDPATAWAADALRAAGFFFAALLPEFIDGDVLRYQRLPGDLGEAEAARFASPACRRLHDRVRAESRDARRNEPGLKAPYEPGGPLHTSRHI